MSLYCCNIWDPPQTSFKSINIKLIDIKMINIKVINIKKSIQKKQKTFLNLAQLSGHLFKTFDTLSLSHTLHNSYDTTCVVCRLYLNCFKIFVDENISKRLLLSCLEFGIQIWLQASVQRQGSTETCQNRLS